MNILGICHDVLVCSACVVIDGKVISAIAEERLDRVKQSRVFPKLSINQCVELAGLSLKDIDEIAVAWNPAIELETIQSGYLTGRVMRSEHMLQVPAQLMRLSGKRAVNMLSINDLWQDAPPVTFIDHHLAHLGNGYYLSPFDEAAVLVLDGYGEWKTSLLAKVTGTTVHKLGEVKFPHSLGMFYGAVTQFLGFKPDSDEWKVMALASYASPNNDYYERMRELVKVYTDGTFKLNLDYFGFYNYGHPYWYSDRFIDAFGAPRQQGESLDLRHQQIAAALQQVFEESATKILISLHHSTGLDSVVVSGGSFMNSVYNGKITKVTPFQQCYISSCPDDSGTSVGAALYLYAAKTGKRPHSCAHNYWGNEFSQEENWETIERYKIPNATVPSNVLEAAAADIADGKLIAWFQGRSEFGQRALGHRSILADPRREEMKEVINSAVKFRERFRPFAPAILSERVSDYFDCPPNTTVPFMEKVLPFRDFRKSQVPAVVHIDGTGRLQTVDPVASPRFYGLIKSFEARTGIPIVLNTSFNLNGEPIVDSPTDAIRTFYSCGLDVLYLGNVRIAK